MLEKASGTTHRLLARVRAMLPEDWFGRAGTQFKKATRNIGHFVGTHGPQAARIGDEAVDLAIRKLEGTATVEHSTAVKNYAEEEEHRIEITLKRRTMESKVRQELAAADKLESESRLSRIKEIDATIDLVNKLRTIGVVLTVDQNSDLTVTNCPSNFDWAGLLDQLGRNRNKFLTPPDRR